MKKMLCGHQFYQTFWIKCQARNDFDFAEEENGKLVVHHVKKDAKFYLNRPSEGIYNVCFKADYSPERDSSRAYYMTFPEKEFHKQFKILNEVVSKDETDTRFENEYYEGGVSPDGTP